MEMSLLFKCKVPDTNELKNHGSVDKTEVAGVVFYHGIGKYQNTVKVIQSVKLGEVL